MAGFVMRRAAGGLAGALLFGSAAAATEVTFPKTAPRMAMTIPDGWSVSYTDLGVEMQSPEKDSLIVAKILKRDRTTVDAWTKKVLTRLMAAGVTVNKPVAAAPPVAAVPAAPVASPPAPAAGPPPQQAAVAAPASPPPDAAPPPAPISLPPVAEPGSPEAMQAPPSEPEMPGTANAPSFTFSGTSSVGMPTLPMTTKLPDSVAAAAAPAPDFGPGGQKVASTINGLHFKVVEFLDAKFKDKPTDIQLVLFTLPKDEVFAVEQQSLPEDNRAVGVSASVKAVK